MAFAALVSLAQTIDLILSYHQHSISTQLKTHVKSINKYVIFLKAFLVDSPKEGSRLEGRIRELTYTAEDTIELLLTEQMRTDGNSEDLRHYFAELERVTKEIESVAKEVMEEHKPSVVGFEKDLIEVKLLLCGESTKLEIVPIVGMGGIGKTTLARYVLNDQYILEKFDIHAWVTVSQNYCVRDVVSSLLYSMGLSHTKDDLDVYQNLKGRRYLIVVDDIWSVEAWYAIKMMFPDDDNGSRIMLTTRQSDLSSLVESSSNVHEMCLMEEDQSWNLLREEVFKRDPCPVELEHVGKMIATSCGGLPLALVVISGLLASIDRSEAAWLNIADNVRSAISANDESFTKIISLSYTHLPHHLRPCFLYLGGFPEDYEMCVSKVIKLWVAEGFLKPNESESLEETAEEYLEELVKRSLISVTKRDYNGRIKHFSMHDLMREICITKALEENFLLHVCGALTRGEKILRRVSIIQYDLDFLGNVNGSTIHTVICLGDRQQGRQCSVGFLRWLRILDLVDSFEYFYKNDSSSTSLPEDVFELFHLRYLALDYPFKIPAYLSNLRNLQTLIISSSNYQDHFVELPVEIWRMPQLRHIVVLSCVVPSQEGVTSVLENLLTLSKAVNLICSKVLLKIIPNLKKLGLFYTRWRDYEVDYQLHNLIHMQILEDLKIEVFNLPEKQQRVIPVFPKTLKKLSLSGLRHSWNDMKIVGSLPNLEVLKLRDDACIGGTWETTDGEYSKLKFLLIEFSDLQNWTTESSHFPRLRCLVLRRCRDLTEIPDGIGDVLTLELIEVDDWNESLVDSAKQIQEDQQSYGNEGLQIRCVRVRAAEDS